MRQENTQYFFPQDKWAEQNPSDWWEQTVECIKELVEKKKLLLKMVLKLSVSQDRCMV